MGQKADSGLLLSVLGGQMEHFMTFSPPVPPRHERFSFLLFFITVAASLAGILGILKWIAPHVWASELTFSIGRYLVAFGGISLVICFVEYFFHRYVLHTSAISFLRHFYRQHTLHHALTRITRKPARAGQTILYIENKFPIEHEEQHEAAFFPWYAMAAFGVVLTPLLIVMHLMLPEFPWFISGYLALVSSLVLYEVLHAINHWPLPTWEPLITHPRWGWFWQPIYGFHLRHHAVIDCNESISGFFGLPLADWVLGTCVIPKTVYAEGEEWTEEKFRSPRPCGLVRGLDAWAQQAMSRRRSQAGARPVSPLEHVPKRSYSRGEELANGLTHGFGAILSGVALVVLVILASLKGEAWHVVGVAVFGVTLLLLYTVSTVYHTRRSEGSRRRFRRWDHSAIFLLIAGTYTPLVLTSLRNAWGWTLLGAVWSICVVGAIVKVRYGERFRQYSTWTYLVAGWLVVLAAKPLMATVRGDALGLLLAGGLFYTVGIIFYSWWRLRYHHAIWHGFVLGGSACHVFAVVLFLPSSV